jgi:hypothetical protein
MVVPHSSESSDMAQQPTNVRPQMAAATTTNNSSVKALKFIHANPQRAFAGGSESSWKDTKPIGKVVSNSRKGKRFGPSWLVYTPKDFVQR